MNSTWEAGFVAMSAALGEPADAVREALGDLDTRRLGGIARALGADSKVVRARALAAALSAVAKDVDAMRLQWR